MLEMLRPVLGLNSLFYLRLGEIASFCLSVAAHTCVCRSTLSVSSLPSPWNSADVWLNTDWEIPAASFPCSSFLHVITVVKLWPVHIDKVPQATQLRQAAHQMWSLLCLPVYLPVHSLWFRHGQFIRATEVFAVKDCMAVCQLGQPILDSLPLAARSLRLWEWC